MSQPKETATVCFALESTRTLPNAENMVIAAASMSVLTAVSATILAALMIFLGLKNHQSERRFCLLVSITLDSIINGIFYFDKYVFLVRKPEPTSKNGILALAHITTTHLPLAKQRLIFVSPGLCETLQFLHEIALCSVVVWLAAECVYLVKAASFHSLTLHYDHQSNFCSWLVPGIMYPATFTTLWLTFKLLYRENWLGCFVKDDYDLVTTIPNCFTTTLTSFSAFCLAIVFCLPKYLRHGQTRFMPCLISWIAVQPVQLMTMLQTFKYVSRKYDFYFGEPQDIIYYILNMCYGLWIVGLYSLLLVCDWRYNRRSIQFAL